jgi:hypothetical protein
MQRLGEASHLSGNTSRSRKVRATPRWIWGLIALLAACGEGGRSAPPPINSTPNAVEAGQPGTSDAGVGVVSDATITTPPQPVDSSTPTPVNQDAGGPSPGSDATTPLDAQGPVVDSGPTGPLTGPFPPVSDFAKDGPYKSTTLKNTGPNNGYTVYLPMELAPGGAKNPIVGWMSGGGTTHDLYPLLPRLATHGFVVVAANVTPGIGEEANLGKQIIAGIDWALAENARSGGMLFGKLDETKIASMGYSMGSLSTFMIASDPRLTTTVHISGGNMAAERINNLRAPAAFICGIPGPSSCGILDSTCDIAATNCDTDFMGAKTPVFYANFNGGHLGILLPPLEDQIGALATTWLRWKLMSDRSLDAKFLGDQCEVCKDKSWTKVQQKNL